jgi:hypothetical protein
MGISETDSFVGCVCDWNILSTEPRIHTGRLDDIANHPLITWFDPAPAVSMETRAQDVLQSKLMICGPGNRPSARILMVYPQTQTRRQRQMHSIWLKHPTAKTRRKS